MEDKMRGIRESEFELKQENITFRSKLQGTVAQIVETRLDLSEKTTQNKILDLETRLGEMMSRVNEIRPQLAAETDDKIRKARFNSDSGVDKFDAVKLVIQKSMH